MKYIYILTLSFLSYCSLHGQGLITKPDMVFSNHTDDATSMAYAPYAKLIATGSWDNQINLYTDDGKFVRAINKHTAAVEALCFSRDGKFLFSGSKDFTAMQFDAATGSALRSFSGHTDNVTALAIDAANKYLFTGSDDGTIKLWDLAAGGTLFKTIPIGSPIHGLCMANDGKSFFVGANSKELLQFDMTGKEIKKYAGHTDFINAIAMSLNNKYLVTAANDKNIILWDAKAGTVLKTLTGHQLKVNSVIFSFDGKYIISGSNDGTCKVWSTETGAELYTFNDKQDNKVRVALISFDKKKIYTTAKMKNQADYGARMWTLPIDTFEKNAPKTSIGEGSKTEKNTGLLNNENRAKQKSPPVEINPSNPNVSKVVTPIGGKSVIDSIEKTKLTMVADTEAMRRSGKPLPKSSAKTTTTPPVANPAAPTVNKSTTPPVNNPAAPPAKTPPAKEITSKTPGNATNNNNLTKTEKIKQAQLEKERKEKEEKDRIEKEKQAAPADTTNEEEEKPKSKFRKLR